jgi:hypothetical protein
MAAQWVDPQKVTGNAVLDYDFSGGQRSRQGTADGRRVHGPACLILVFRPPKNSDLTPPDSGVRTPLP